MNKYTVPQTAEAYAAWLSSEDGETQKAILGSAVLKSLPQNSSLMILDAACGTGWLTSLLAQAGHKAQGCDESEPLIKRAQVQAPELQFKITSLEQPLPYPDAYFDIVTLNMAAQDLMNLEGALNHINKTLKPNGSLILTIPNPYYAYPAAVWKRGIIGRILGHKPVLKLWPWPLTKQDIAGHQLSWSNHWRPLSVFINALATTGFSVTTMQELKSDQDADHFCLQYQLYRYPLFLLLECKKRGE